MASARECEDAFAAPLLESLSGKPASFVEGVARLLHQRAADILEQDIARLIADSPIEALCVWPDWSLREIGADEIFVIVEAAPSAPHCRGMHFPDLDDALDAMIARDEKISTDPQSGVGFLALSDRASAFGDGLRLRLMTAIDALMEILEPFNINQGHATWNYTGPQLITSMGVHSGPMVNFPGVMIQHGVAPKSIAGMFGIALEGDSRESKFAAFESAVTAAIAADSGDAAELLLSGAFAIDDDQRRLLEADAARRKVAETLLARRAALKM